MTSVVVERDDFRLEVDLSVAAGETVAVLGPNGAGKSTLLEVLAGLVGPNSGRVTIDGAVVDNPAAGVRVAPERRSVGYVFQDNLLFPHLSALDNVAFGLRCRRVPRSTARRTAQLWLERLGVGEQGRSRPGDLSGGQAQRVALARALATDPGVLLLDEPLSALDVEARGLVRGELRAHLGTFAGPRMLVTHDPVDAMVLADRLIVLESGRITHDGPPGEMTRRPRTTYVASLVGLNFYRGRMDRGLFEVDTGGVLVGVGPVDSAVAPVTLDRPGASVATFRPQAVAIHRSRPEGTPRNVWECQVRGIDVTPDRVRVELAGSPSVVAEITPAALADLALVPGNTVWVAVKASEITVGSA